MEQAVLGVYSACSHHYLQEALIPISEAPEPVIQGSVYSTIRSLDVLYRLVRIVTEDWICYR
jgi:hypothetical protein